MTRSDADPLQDGDRRADAPDMTLRLVPPEPSPEDRAERAERVEELRRRYLEGTLEAVLVPAEPQLDTLVRDLFPRRPRPS